MGRFVNVKEEKKGAINKGSKGFDKGRNDDDDRLVEIAGKEEGGSGIPFLLGCCCCSLMKF